MMLTRTRIANLKKLIAASRIQNTWRSYAIDKNARYERYVAKYNKVANGNITNEKHCIPSEKMKIDKKNVSFGYNLMAVNVMDSNEKLYYEPIETEDGSEKDMTLFTLTFASWLTHLGNKEDFFIGFPNKYVNSPGSKKWNEILDSLTDILDNGQIVRLWGHLGGTKTIYPLQKLKVKLFQKHWNIYKRPHLEPIIEI